MTANGKLKSTELRDELIRIDGGIVACKQDESEAHALIRSLARAAIAPDPGDALQQIKKAEGKLGSAKMAHRRLYDARAEVEADLAAALAEEDQQQREADAKAAEVFAEGLPNLFTEVDRHLAEFRRSYTACFAVIREARARGWVVPSEELMTSKMYRALKTAFSVGELRAFDMSPLPAPERCTFNSIGESYAQSVLGGAKHLAKPPSPPPLPTPPAARSDDRKLPRQGDVGVRFRDDPKEFEIRIPTGRS
jgi:hypothetical protein